MLTLVSPGVGPGVSSELARVVLSYSRVSSGGVLESELVPELKLELELALVLVDWV